MIYSFEGLPGGGKSTLIENIKSHFSGSQNIYIHKPFLRSEIINLLKEKHISQIDDLNKITNDLISALDYDKLFTQITDNHIIIIDRFIDSIGGILYGYFYPIFSISDIYNYITTHINKIQTKKIILNINMETSKKRIYKRKNIYYDDSTISLFYKMIDYLIYVNHIEKEYHIIDGLNTPKEIFNDFSSIHSSYCSL